MRSSASIGIVSSAAIVRKRGRGTVMLSDMGYRYYPASNFEKAKCRMQKARRRMQKRTVAVIIALFLHFALCILQSASPSDFRLAEPGYDYAFPRDHGSHDEYRTEW